MPGELHHIFIDFIHIHMSLQDETVDSIARTWHPQKLEYGRVEMQD